MTEQQGRDHRPLNYEPAQTSGYLDKRYWDERFQEEEDYDWFKKFEEFSHLLLPSLQQSDKILMIGCGNSSLTFDLCKLGYQNITSIDLSEVSFCLLACASCSSSAYKHHGREEHLRAGFLEQELELPNPFLTAFLIQISTTFGWALLEVRSYVSSSPTWLNLHSLFLSCRSMCCMPKTINICVNCIGDWKQQALVQVHCLAKCGA